MSQIEALPFDIDTLLQTLFELALSNMSEPTRQWIADGAPQLLAFQQSVFADAQSGLGFILKQSGLEGEALQTVVSALSHVMAFQHRALGTISTMGEFARGERKQIGGNHTVQ